MGPLAEPTPAGVRNIGAAQRKKPRRVEATRAGRGQAASTVARDARTRQEEDDAHRRQEEIHESAEDMDDVLAAVAAAISQMECEAAEAQKEAVRMERTTGGMQEDGTAQASEAERHTEARRRAIIFLQGMENPKGGSPRKGGQQATTGGKARNRFTQHRKWKRQLHPRNTRINRGRLQPSHIGERAHPGFGQRCMERMVEGQNHQAKSAVELIRWRILLGGYGQQRRRRRRT